VNEAILRTGEGIEREELKPGLASAAPLQEFIMEPVLVTARAQTRNQEATR